MYAEESAPAHAALSSCLLYPRACGGTCLGNDEGSALNFVCSDPDHDPEIEGKVDITTDPENTEVITSLEAGNARIHIEQMSNRNYWAGIQSGSYNFLSGEDLWESEGPEIKLIRISSWETGQLAGGAG